MDVIRSEDLSRLSPGEILRSRTSAPARRGEVYEEFSEQYTSLAEALSLEDVSVVVERRAEAPSSLVGSRITLDGSLLPVAPESLDLDDPSHRTGLATLHGLFLHDLAHVLFTRWSASGLTPLEASLASALEDLRVEHRLVVARPSSRQYLRAASAKRTESLASSYRDPAELTLLLVLATLGRALLSVLDPSDAAPALAVLDTTLSDAATAEVLDVVSALKAVRDDDRTTMLALTKRLVALLTPESDSEDSAEDSAEDAEDAENAEDGEEGGEAPGSTDSDPADDDSGEPEGSDDAKSTSDDKAAGEEPGSEGSEGEGSDGEDSNSEDSNGEGPNGGDSDAEGSKATSSNSEPSSDSDSGSEASSDPAKGSTSSKDAHSEESSSSGEECTTEASDSEDSRAGMGSAVEGECAPGGDSSSDSSAAPSSSSASPSSSTPSSAAPSSSSVSAGSAASAPSAPSAASTASAPRASLPGTTHGEGGRGALDPTVHPPMTPLSASELSRLARSLMAARDAASSSLADGPVSAAASAPSTSTSSPAASNPGLDASLSALTDLLVTEEKKRSKAPRHTELSEYEEAEWDMDEDLTGLEGPHGFGYGGGLFSSTREPKSPERVMRRRLTDRLRRARFRERTTTEVTSLLPPGRLSTREVMKGAAERSQGHLPTARPWKSRHHRFVESPTLRVAILCDVSGSMSAVVGAVASSMWVTASAVVDTGGTSVGVAFGDEASVIVEKGYKAPQMVSTFPANGGREAIYDALRLADDRLDLFNRTTRSTSARIVIVVSDGVWVDAAQSAAADRELKALMRSGVKVIHVGAGSTPSPHPGDVTTVMSSAKDIDKVVADACERALRTL